MKVRPQCSQSIRLYLFPSCVTIDVGRSEKEEEEEEDIDDGGSDRTPQNCALLSNSTG